MHQLTCQRQYHRVLGGLKCFKLFEDSRQRLTIACYNAEMGVNFAADFTRRQTGTSVAALLKFTTRCFRSCLLGITRRVSKQDEPDRMRSRGHT